MRRSLRNQSPGRQQAVLVQVCSERFVVHPPPRSVSWRQGGLPWHASRRVPEERAGMYGDCCDSLTFRNIRRCPPRPAQLLETLLIARINADAVRQIECHAGHLHKPEGAVALPSFVSGGDSAETLEERRERGCAGRVRLTLVPARLAELPRWLRAEAGRACDSSHTKTRIGSGAGIHSRVNEG